MLSILRMVPVAHTHIHTQLYTHTHIQCMSYTHAFTRTHTHTFTCTHTHTYTRTHTYSYTHTPAQFIQNHTNVYLCTARVKIGLFNGNLGVCVCVCVCVHIITLHHMSVCVCVCVCVYIIEATMSSIFRMQRSVSVARETALEETSRGCGGRERKNVRECMCVKECA
jgi:hypothetical protein